MKGDPTRFLNADELKVLDLIREYPKSSEELREIMGIAPYGLVRTMGRLKRFGCIERVTSDHKYGTVWRARV